MFPKNYQGFFSKKKQKQYWGKYLFRMSQKIVDIKLPRLLLQIMHEWSSPAEKKVEQIKDENDEALEGDYIGVYQDVFLEMIESDAEHSFLSEDIDNR